MGRAIPKFGAAVVGTLLFASAAACLVTPDIGNESGTCSAGRTCTCDGIGNCDYECPAGDCNFVCDNLGNCDFTCAGGSCNLTCEGTSNCFLSCPGNNCAVVCAGTGNCGLNDCGSSCQIECRSTGTCSCPTGC
jgi:hypothetical protein